MVGPELRLNHSELPWRLIVCRADSQSAVTACRHDSALRLVDRLSRFVARLELGEARAREGHAVKSVS